MNNLCNSSNKTSEVDVLSSAAQMVLNAIEDHDEFSYRRLAAATLRAAALQCKRDTLILLSITDELEGSND